MKKCGGVGSVMSSRAPIVQKKEQDERNKEEREY